MSALRLGIRPDGTREVRILDDGVEVRLSVTRYGSWGGGEYVVPRKSNIHTIESVRTNPDNGAVEAPITEVHL